MYIEHDLACPKGGLVLALHYEAAKEWGDLGAQDLFPSALTYELEINSRTVQGESNGAGAQQGSGTSEGGAHTVGEYQGGSGPTVNGADVLARRKGQVEVHAYSRTDVSAHGFWKQGTTAMFDIRISNMNTGSCLCMSPEKALAKAEKGTKDLYPQDCLERRRIFTPMVYYADGIP